MPIIKPISNQVQAIKQTMQSVKIDDGRLQVTIQPPTPDPVTQTYNRDTIEQQLSVIQTQLDDFTNARQAEIDTLNAILSLMDDNEVVNLVKDN
jgi:hypothetical protein